MTSLVIFCFEMLHGNHESAAKQVLIGLDLIDDEMIKDEQLRKDAGFFYSRMPNVEDELVQAFGRLDIQTMSFIDQRPIGRHAALKAYGSSTVTSMPEEFSSLEEARMYLEIVMPRLMHLMASISPDTHYFCCWKSHVLFCIPDHYIEQRAKYLDEHERCFAAFAPLARVHESDKKFLGAKALELLYLTS